MLRAQALLPVRFSASSSETLSKSLALFEPIFLAINGCDNRTCLLLLRYSESSSWHMGFLIKASPEGRFASPDLRWRALIRVWHLVSPTLGQLLLYVNLTRKI